MVMSSDNITHATNVRVIDQSHNGSLSSGANLFGVIRPLPILLAAVLVGRLTRHNLNSHLNYMSIIDLGRREKMLTCSPVS